MKKLIIFGNTIMAKIAWFYFGRDSGREIVGFTVDAEYNDKGEFCGLSVFDFETLEKTHPPSEYDLFIAIGPSKMNAVREMKFLKAKSKGYGLASYISPHAICDSPVGENCFVGDRAVINPFARIGNNNYLYEAIVVSNNSIIGNHCYLSPNAYVGTFCQVEDNSIIGAGAILKTSVNVAYKTLIGAAAYISKNTEAHGVYGQKSTALLGCISDKIDISLGFGG
jgi:sugar O-acyltransferase (sialic acid O-acetyltransferase NeuD family)